jgi:integrase
LQFEALLTAARQSAHPCGFALVAMLGLLGLRIFEANGADITDPGEEYGHRVLRVCGKGTKVVLIPLPQATCPAVSRTRPRKTWTGASPGLSCSARDAVVLSLRDERAEQCHVAQQVDVPEVALADVGVRG